jgi:hypothetical protein
MAKIVNVILKLAEGDVKVGVRVDTPSRAAQADYVLAAVHKLFGRQCLWENIEDTEGGCRGRVVRRLRPTLYRSEVKDVPQTPDIDIEVAMPTATSVPTSKAAVVYFEVHFPGQEPFIAAARVPRFDENGNPWPERDLCRLAADRFASKCGSTLKTCARGKDSDDAAVIGKIRVSLNVEC